MINVEEGHWENNSICMETLVQCTFSGVLNTPSVPSGNSPSEINIPRCTAYTLVHCINITQGDTKYFKHSDFLVFNFCRSHCWQKSSFLLIRGGTFGPTKGKDSHSDIFSKLFLNLVSFVTDGFNLLLSLLPLTSIILLHVS